MATSGRHRCGTTGTLCAGAGVWRLRLRWQPRGRRVYPSSAPHADRAIQTNLHCVTTWRWRARDARVPRCPVPCAVAVARRSAPCVSILQRSARRAALLEDHCLAPLADSPVLSYVHISRATVRSALSSGARAALTAACSWARCGGMRGQGTAATYEQRLRPSRPEALEYK